MINASDINNDPNNYRFIDTENMIEYIFVCFEEPLPVEEKIRLVKIHGLPRQSNTTRTYKNGAVKITIENAASKWERQMILKD